jgi:mycothiol synthase
LAAAASRHDGLEPLSEVPLLRLELDEPWLTHVVARSHSGGVVGYAQIDRSGADASAELVVHPSYRRRGTGSILLATAARDAHLPQFGGEPGQRGKRLTVWAHGNLDCAQGFAAAQGYAVVRELLLLDRSLDGAGQGIVQGGRAGGQSGDRLAAGAGDGIRLFSPGADDQAWLALNAAAFASHPEQGRLTVDDLHQRMSQPWFDAEGFFVIPADGADDVGHRGLAAYLWTKIHPATGSGDEGGGDEVAAGTSGEVHGEIYALGVAPACQGQGLAKRLLRRALAYLAEQGCSRVVLYVDGDNSPALAAYRAAGFTQAALDVQYAALTI